MARSKPSVTRLPARRSRRTGWLVLLIVAALVAGGWHLLRKPVSSTAQIPSPAGLAAGTPSMAARLDAIAREADPAHNPFLNRQRAGRLQARLRADLPPQEQFNTRLEMALEFLRAGETQTAIEAMNRLPDIIPQLPAAQQAQSRWLVKQYLGLAWMRLGEQDNCIARHTSQSCLWPIEGGGVHEIQKGSRTAIEHLTAALTDQPQDIESVWLLNLAYMTLGEYPDRVPRQWLLPPRLFESAYDIRRFPDLAPDVGLAVRGHAGGACLEDFDNDGLLDLFKSSWGLRDPLQFFRNNGDSTFTERTKEAGLDGLTGGLNLLHADYDNDGWRDVLVLRGAWLGAHGRHPNSLLRNLGDGRFADVTEAAGVLSFFPTQTAAWFDYDGDGWLDLFIGNESPGDTHHPCELYHNNRDGTFTECAAAAGAAIVSFVKGVAAGDYDNDGRPDLYLSCFERPNVLLRNAGPQPGPARGGAPAWRFEDVTSSAGVAEPHDSFPTWFFDYDNDGWLDLFVASYSWQESMAKVAADYLGAANPGATPRLYRNNGHGAFSDATVAQGLNKVLVAMGANFGDLDNDGWLDAYIGTGDPVLSSLMPNRMFRNAGGQRFQDVTTSGGFGHLQKGHAIAFGDVDNDGDQDIFAVLGGAYEGDQFQSALFHNPGHGHHWLTLRLRGTTSNRDAIGARIEVRVSDDTGRRSVFTTVSTGGSFGSSSLQQEIGLGAVRAIESVTVRWPLPGLPVQTFTNLPLDSVIELREGDPQARVLPMKRFTLAGAEGK